MFHGLVAVSNKFYLHMDQLMHYFFLLLVPPYLKMQVIRVYWRWSEEFHYMIYVTNHDHCARIMVTLLYYLHC